jgi:hypothetical protein
MNRRIRDMWVAALRSGEFKQGRGWLRQAEPNLPEMPDAFCCLGVLCELYRRETGEGVWAKKAVGQDTYPRGEFSFHLSPLSYSDSLTPAEVAEWAEMGCRDPWMDDERYGERSLSGLNDDGVDFPTIADVIERNSL